MLLFKYAHFPSQHGGIQLRSTRKHWYACPKSYLILEITDCGILCQLKPFLQSTTALELPHAFRENTNPAAKKIAPAESKNESLYEPHRHWHTGQGDGSGMGFP
eukprot:4742591-Amphidinium_carterae.1